MKVCRICTVFFSPTGGTERLACLLAKELAAVLGVMEERFPLTLPADRRKELSFGPTDLVVAASPVYAGRLPNKLAPEYEKLLHGCRTPVIPLCVFGNRSPGDALREWLLLLERCGFLPVAAASVVCRHAFSDEIGAGRPDAEDHAELCRFVHRVEKRLEQPEPVPLAYDRETPLAPYYTPLKTDGTPARFLKARPVRWEENCTHCGICAARCPMGSIERDTLLISGICIKCQACVRACPTHAIHFEDPDFLSHVAMLRRDYTDRAVPTFL